MIWKLEQGKDTDAFTWIYREREDGSKEYLAGTAGRIPNALALEILPLLNAPTPEQVIEEQGWEIAELQGTSGDLAGAIHAVVTAWMKNVPHDERCIIYDSLPELASGLNRLAAEFGGRK